MIDKFVPESVLARLTVGQRVRYVPPAEECLVAPAEGTPAAHYKATAHEAIHDAEGKTGIIHHISNEIPNHPYVINMDETFRFGDQVFNAIELAAHELAIVEE